MDKKAKEKSRPTTSSSDIRAACTLPLVIKRITQVPIFIKIIYLVSLCAAVLLFSGFKEAPRYSLADIERCEIESVVMAEAGGESTEGQKVDSEIARLKSEITDIMQQISELNKSADRLTWDQFQWKKRALYALDCRRKELTDLKSKRKVANEVLTRHIEQVFKQVVKEELGEIEYARLIGMAEQQLAAYQVKDLAKQPYSNKGKAVTNIAKL